VVVRLSKEGVSLEIEIVEVKQEEVEEEVLFQSY